MAPITQVPRAAAAGPGLVRYRETLRTPGALASCRLSAHFRYRQVRGL